MPKATAKAIMMAIETLRVTAKPIRTVIVKPMVTPMAMQKAIMTD